MNAEDMAFLQQHFTAVRQQLETMTAQVNQRLDTMGEDVRRLGSQQIELIRSQERLGVKVDQLESNFRHHDGLLDTVFNKIRDTNADLECKIAATGKAFAEEIETIEGMVKNESDDRKKFQNGLGIKIALITGAIVAAVAFANFVGFKVVTAAIRAALAAA